MSCDRSGGETKWTRRLQRSLRRTPSRGTVLLLSGIYPSTWAAQEGSKNQQTRWGNHQQQDITCIYLRWVWVFSQWILGLP